MAAEPPGILRDPASTRAQILPHERVFPIQIGNELFRLSGASISSDGPSYFSQFFESQLKRAEESGDDSPVRTLYIDRDPGTFRDIAQHLQGYHIAPRDGSHFVKLFADAQFYSCMGPFELQEEAELTCAVPRLISQLYEENIFISIGNRDFSIPRELFSDPGNSPNYFSLGFAVFFSTPTQVFPGLNREGLLRPPSIIPPSVPNRSSDTFAELLHLLRGYPLHIRDADHRAELLRDCRYFHLKGLEQRLIHHTISFNLCRKRHEITLRLEDVRQSGISVVGDTSPTSLSETSRAPACRSPRNVPGYVNYARPFVDDRPSELVLEIGDECTRLHLSSMRCEFFGDGKARISRLFEVIATKLNLPNPQPLGMPMQDGGVSSQPASPDNTPIGGDWVRCMLGQDAYVRLDGKDWHSTPHLECEDERLGAGAGWIAAAGQDLGERAPKRLRTAGSTTRVTEDSQVWVLRRAQWRLRVQDAQHGRGRVECVLVAVKLDAFASEAGRNAQRGFLAG
ncbi:BTB/POZ domain-containing protein [Marssonina coronariae]|uniref:BTB/POZ domain-containing protein n=1 Tax=Diplocarpon coronariae TaxID=2795749 RepID=A0A218YSX5_9HELO|nr:BTB/POZ domain-containing protein [Marssonina coronariae]